MTATICFFVMEICGMQKFHETCCACAATVFATMQLEFFFISNYYFLHDFNCISICITMVLFICMDQSYSFRTFIEGMEQ